jgi:L-lysine exporter family protein LysE/ArgO
LDSVFFPFLSGIAMGVVLGFGFGTIFFALIQNSINHGFKKGLDIALGVVISDILLISLILFGSQYLDEVQKFRDIIKYAGGILLVMLGIYQFFPQKVNTDKNGELISKGRFYFMSKGFVLNFMNPINFLAWLSIQIHLKGVSDYSNLQSIYFFLGAILSIFGIEIGISLLANYIGKKLSNKVIKVINYTAGYIFIVLGLILMFKKI